ncbi:MAG TPA: phasin family protein [Bellilinea sp.]|nr:phasin family protein [Bellilinea sp.]
MNDQDVQENDQENEDYPTQRLSFYHTARKVLLASIGAVALAQDEIEEFVNRMIERGELAENEGRKLMDEVKAYRQNKFEKAENLMTGRLENMLKRINIPTKADIDSLSERIASLSRKLDELADQQGK